jgi:hypothetical protein
MFIKPNVSSTVEVDRRTKCHLCVDFMLLCSEHNDSKSKRSEPIFSSTMHDASDRRPKRILIKIRRTTCVNHGGYFGWVLL